MSIIGSGSTQVQSFTEEMQQASFNMGVGLFGISLGTTFLNELATYMTQTSGATIDTMYEVVMAGSVGQHASYYPNYLTNAQFADRLAKNLLGTKGAVVADDAWQAGADWAQAALDGGMSRAAVAKMAVDAVAAIPADDAYYGAAVSTFNNKVAVSEYYTLTAGGSSTSITTLGSTLTNVTSTTDVSTPAALDTILNATPAGTSGETFTLTTAMDSVGGGSGNDAIYGSLTGSNDTFNAYDQLNGGGGTDLLSLTLGSDYDGGGSISNIENFAIKATAAKYFDFNGIDGVQQIMSDRSTNVLTAKNIASTSVTVGMNVVSNTAADLTAKFTDSALNGTNDTVTVALTGGVGSSSSASGDNEILVTSTSSTNGAENLTINVTGGAAYIGKIESEEGSGNTQVLKKVTVTGDSSLKIIDALDFVGTDTATFDASAATGGVTAGMDVNITKMSVIGGSGNDVFSMSTGLNSTDTIDGGAGTDTVKADGVNGAATTFTLADLKLSNIEVFDARSDTGDALVLVTDGQAGLEKVVLRENATDDTNMTVSDLAVGVAVDIISDKDAGDENTGDVTLGLKDASSTADTLTVTLKGTSGHAAASNTLDKLTVSNIETLALVSSHDGTTALTSTDTNTITSLAADTLLTKVTASGSDALSVTMSGAETKLVAFDGSAMTDVLTVDVSSLTSDIAVTGGSEDDSFVFGSTLNNKDTVDGGSNSTDSTNEDILTATITNLTSTTGALNVANVERLNLTNAGTAVINAAGITNATEIAILTNTTQTTISNLAAGIAVGLGQKDTNGTADGTLVVSLADETGTADALTINLNDTDGTQTTTATIKATAIETVTFNVNSTTDTTMADAALTVSSLNAATVKVTGSKADTGHTLSLGTLDTDTKTVDASGYYGIMTVTAGSATGTTVTAKAGAAHNITGSSNNDTITISGGTANAAYVVNGNGGTDSLTITANNGAMDLDDVSDVDTVTLDVANSAAVTFGVDANTSDGLNAATTVKITGGNSISSVTIGVTPVGTFAAAHATVNSDGSVGGLTAATTTLFDASGFNGKLSNVVFTSNGLDDSIDVKGGASAEDKVTAIYSASKTIKSMTGIEIFEINATGTVAIDLKNVDGLTKVMLDDDGTARVVTLTDLDAGVDIEVEHGVTASGVVVDLIDSSAADNAVKIDIKTTATDTHTYTIDSGANNDIETLNLVMSDSSKIDLDGWTIATASKYSTLNVTGAGNLTLTAIDGDIRTINGTEMTGALVMEVAGSTSAKSITSSSGADTLFMANTADTLDAGSGTDTLKISAHNVLGGIAVDLSSTVDQITTFNGSSNAAVQKGFESVDLSALTGTSGADITAHSGGSTIVGTGNADVINGGAGVDSITGGQGADVISLGDGVDHVIYTAAGTDAAVGTITLAAGAVTRTAVTNWTIAAGDTVVGAETISGISTTDGSGETITLGNADISAIVAGTVGTIIDDTACIVQGTYSNGTFTVGVGLNTGADSLLVWDSDASASISYQTVVIIGMNSTVEGYLATAAGVLTM